MAVFRQLPGGQQCLDAVGKEKTGGKKAYQQPKRSPMQKT